MASRYTQKTWVSEVISSTDMNRMEYGISGRVWYVDPTGTMGDFATIALAITQCVGDGYGTIRLMGGIHTPAAKLAVSGVKIAIVANRDATIKKPNALNDNLMEITNGFVTLYGLIIDGNKANQAGGASDIYISASSDINIEDCYFQNAYAHAIMWANNTSSRRNRIINCGFDSSNTAAIYASINNTGYLRETFIENCTFQGIVNEAIYLILANTSYGLWIIDNQIDGTSQAASMNGIFVDANGSSPLRTMIMHNDVINITGTGIYASIVNGKVDDNHCGGCVESGIECYGSVNTVSDNSVDAITLYGIYFDDTSGGTIVANNSIINIGRDGILVSDSNAKDCKITGNLMWNVGTSSNNTYSGVKVVQPTNFTIDNNTVIGKAANKHKYSVDEAGTGNFVMCNTSKSDVSGGATNGVNVTGTGSVAFGNQRIA